MIKGEHGAIYIGSDKSGKMTELGKVGQIGIANAEESIPLKLETSLSMTGTFTGTGFERLLSIIRDASSATRLTKALGYTTVNGVRPDES